LAAEPAAQLALVERAVAIAVELVEQLRRRSLCFGQVDRAVVVGIERLQALRPSWHGRGEGEGEGCNQDALPNDHGDILLIRDAIIISRSAVVWRNAWFRRGSPVISASAGTRYPRDLRVTHDGSPLAR